MTATMSVSDKISLIEAATEAYLGYIDLLFDDDEELVATESKKGDKNLAKAQQNYEKKGKNAEDAKNDLSAKSINDGETTVVGSTTKTEMKKKTIGQSLSDILKAIKEFFLSIFGQKIPQTTVVPVLHTEPDIDQQLNMIEDAFMAMTRANTTEEWDAAYVKFKEQVQNFGSRLATCRKELAANKENNKILKKEKVAPGNQIKKLEKMNRTEFKSVGELEAVHKDLAKIMRDLAAFYENKTVKRFFRKDKELTIEELREKTSGTFHSNEKTVRKGISKAHNTVDKDKKRVANYQNAYGTSTD